MNPDGGVSLVLLAVVATALGVAVDRVGRTALGVVVDVIDVAEFGRNGAATP